jgi:hypothetical protein
MKAEGTGPFGEKECDLILIQAGYRDGGWVGSEGREESHFSGPTRGHHVLVQSLFSFPQVVNDRERETLTLTYETTWRQNRRRHQYHLIILFTCVA